MEKGNFFILNKVVIQWIYKKNVNKLTILYFIIATGMAPKQVKYCWHTPLSLFIKQADLFLLLWRDRYRQTEM